MNTIPRQEKQVTPDGKQTINPELNAKIIKMGYVWLCYSAVVTTIIMSMPEALIDISLINSAMDFVTSKMPYVIYLSKLSAKPESVVYSFSVVLLATPVNAIFSIAAIIMSHMAGYKHYENNKGKSIIIACLWILGTLGLFFTCLGCSAKPDWRDLFMISSRLIMAILGQAASIGVFVCVGVLSLAVLIKLRLLKSTG
jgi:hypothetical protein